MEWDPIGVAGVAGAQDEYDCMISPLLHLLFDGADQDEILEWIRTESGPLRSVGRLGRRCRTRGEAYVLVEHTQLEVLTVRALDH